MRERGRTRVSEADLSRLLRDWLGWKGYEVLQIGTGRRRVLCPGCGSVFYPSGWQGNTPGAPDLFLRHPSWPAFVWLAVELKGEKTPIRQEQKRLIERGGVCLVRSLEELQKALEEFNARPYRAGEGEGV